MNNVANQDVMKVSVCVISYNQEKYIEQCLMSLLNQKVNFDFEILVSDDASTDNTQAIIKKIASEYPNIVKAFLHEKQLGGGGCGNYWFVHKQAKGEYIAHMDGDDYALPGKLQKQADFLDENLGCSFVGHRVANLDSNSGELIANQHYKNEVTLCNLERLVKKGIFFVHSSKMYRREACVFDHSTNQNFIDLHLHIEHASMGNIGFISETLGVYRVGCGITNLKGEPRYILFDYTLTAYERARELGVKNKIVDYAKSMFLIKVAITCYLNRDLVGYQKYRELSYLSGWNYPGFLTFILKYLVKDRTNFLMSLLNIRSFFIKPLQ